MEIRILSRGRRQYKFSNIVRISISTVERISRILTNTPAPSHSSLDRLQHLSSFIIPRAPGIREQLSLIFVAVRSPKARLASGPSLPMPGRSTSNRIPAESRPSDHEKREPPAIRPSELSSSIRPSRLVHAIGEMGFVSALCTNGEAANIRTLNTIDLRYSESPFGSAFDSCARIANGRW